LCRAASTAWHCTAGNGHLLATQRGSGAFLPGFVLSKKIAGSELRHISSTLCVAGTSSSDLVNRLPLNTWTWKTSGLLFVLLSLNSSDFLNRETTYSLIALDGVKAHAAPGDLDFRQSALANPAI